MNRPLTRKDALSFSLMSLIIVVQCLSLHGCTSLSEIYLLPEIYPSNQLPPYVRQISHIRVYANMPTVDTGIDIRKNEFY